MNYVESTLDDFEKQAAIGGLVGATVGGIASDEGDTFAGTTLGGAAGTGLNYVTKGYRPSLLEGLVATRGLRSMLEREGKVPRSIIHSDKIDDLVEEAKKIKDGTSASSIKPNAKELKRFLRASKFMNTGHLGYWTPKALLGAGGGLLVANALSDDGLFGNKKIEPTPEPISAPTPEPTPEPSNLDKALQFYNDNQTTVNSLAALAALGTAGTVGYKAMSNKPKKKKN